MQVLRNEIDSRIKCINFDKLWPGFIQYEYALYDNENAYFDNSSIPIDHRFMGNTSIEFENRYVAIWKIHNVDEIDFDILTASIIHEMFHAHQMTLGESRFYSDLEGLKYPWDIENFKQKHVELLALADAQLAQNIADKREMFNRFVSIRLQRQNLTHYIDYEKAIETIEGSAEFITLSVLRILNEKKYAKRMEMTVEKVSLINKEFFDTRRLAYYSGALICSVAQDLGIIITSSIGIEKRYIFDLIPMDSNIHASDNLDKEEEVNLIKASEMYVKEVKRKIDDVLNHKDMKVINGDFTVCGYDPMNMVKFEDKIFHKSFLGIMINSEFEFIPGPIVVEIDNEDYKKITKYHSV